MEVETICRRYWYPKAGYVKLCASPRPFHINCLQEGSGWKQDWEARYVGYLTNSSGCRGSRASSMQEFTEAALLTSCGWLVPVETICLAVAAGRPGCCVAVGGGSRGLCWFEENDVVVCVRPVRNRCCCLCCWAREYEFARECLSIVLCEPVAFFFMKLLESFGRHVRFSWAAEGDNLNDAYPASSRESFLDLMEVPLYFHTRESVVCTADLVIGSLGSFMPQPGCTIAFHSLRKGEWNMSINNMSIGNDAVIGPSTV